MEYELKSARYLARETLARAVTPGSTVVDATMGNGHDTLFLSEMVGKGGKVYAFDIQPEALASTERLLKEYGIQDRAELILAGHERMAEFVKEPARAIVFNLGWLPGGDHSVTTRWETTRTAVESALNLLQPMGVLIICVYPGHPEGSVEREQLTKMLSGLSNREYNVLHERFLNATEGAPECFTIQKQRNTRW